MTTDKLLSIDGVVRTEANAMFLYGRTLMDMSALIGFPVKKDSDGNPIINAEMYRIDAEGIHVA